MQTLTLQSSVLGGQIVYEDSPLVCTMYVCPSVCFSLLVCESVPLSICVRVFCLSVCLSLTVHMYLHAFVSVCVSLKLMKLTVFVKYLLQHTSL